MIQERARPLVLLVDDSPTQAQHAAQALEMAGFRVQFAANGREALDQARKWRPDVIVSDILMPIMDGFALCREIRRDVALRSVPMVLHTITYLDPKDEEFALALGATRFVLKPSDPAVLVAEVRAVLASGHVYAVSSADVDDAFLKGYSERLAAKLEEKVGELEEANRLLARQYQETAAARDRLALLLDASQAASSSLDVNVLLERLAQRLVTAVDGTLCRISLLDTNNERLVVEAGYRTPDFDREPAFGDSVVLAEAPLFRSILSAGEPRVVPQDVSDSEMTLAERHTAWLGPNQAVLLVPLKVAGNPAGLMFLGKARDSERNPFSADQIELVVAMASQAAVAIENAGLHRAQLQAEREMRLVEQQLRQSQKMEVVGTLAGGIAHDFNNLLTAIIGFGELTMAEFERDNPVRAHVREMVSAGERAAGLTRQLLAFSRRQVLQPELLDLNSIVEDMEKMLRRVIPENIAIMVTLDPALGTVRADRGQLEQVVLNLAINARDAMPDGGTLTIDTANVDLSQSYMEEHGVRGFGISEPGPYVRISVSDNGIGMDAETQERIFEPFFTTKEEGKGTGLGLATVYGIVKQSGGDIWVYSEPGYGTTFNVYLRRLDEPRVVRELAELARPARGSETILLVEDTEPVRALAKAVLQASGYTVLEAEGGEAALRIFAGQGGLVDLVISDVIMPDFNGPELAVRLREQRPGLRVLFTSGYPGEMAMTNGMIDESTPYLQKPFTPRALNDAVRQVLDSPENLSSKRPMLGE